MIQAKADVIYTILELIATYGLPLVKSVIDSLKLDSLEELKEQVTAMNLKDAEEYFE